MIKKTNQTLAPRQSPGRFTGAPGLARKCLAFLAGILLLGFAGNASAEDAYEPNNSTGQAVGFLENATITAESFDEDWWFLWSPGGGNDQIFVDLFHTHSQGDLELDIYAPNGTLLTSSTSTTDNELVQVDAAVRGYYRFRVRAFSGYTGQSYQFRWEVTDDNFEPNDSSGTGPTLPENTLLSTIDAPGSGNIYKSPGSAFDDDWFTISVPPGRLNLNIYCTFSDSASDIELELWNSAGSSRLALANSSSDNEAISFAVPSSGTYQIKTRTSGTPNGNTYDLLWTASSASDNYEPNDIREFAYGDFREDRPLTNDRGAASSGADDDFYKITVSASEPNLTIDLNGFSGGTDLDLQLLDSNGAVVGSSGSSSSTEQINYTAAPGDYFVRVFTFGGPSIDYNLTWTADAGPTTTISPPSNNLPAVGGSYGITVTSNTNWSVTGLPSWASASPTSGSNNGVVNITVQSNGTVNARSQTIMIGGNSHDIMQAAAGATTSITPANHNSPSGGDSYSISVTSNTSWNVTGLPLWATASPSSGTGSGTVSVSVSANPTITARNQSISIGGQSHLISQAAAQPTTSISPPSKNVDQAGEAYQINVSSNAPWSVSGIPSWIQVSPSSGSGNGSVTVTVATNLPTAARTATLTINGNQHTVVQPGNPKDLALINRLTKLVKKQQKKIKKALQKGKKDKAKKLKKKLGKLKSALRRAKSA